MELARPSEADAFELLAAIDLRDRRVVRLQQGDFERETAFSDDPVATAVRFAGQGALWLHVVDLDGARSGSPAHSTTIAAIVAAVAGRTRVEVAGGLRTADAVARVLAGGAARAVVGTAALHDATFAAALTKVHGPERIAVAIDVRDGLALGDGWREGAAGKAPDTLINDLADADVQTFEVTAIDRDGLLGGPDLDLLRRLVELDCGRIVASGGIRSVADLRSVRQIGCAGAIVGRALYDGSMDLRDAIGATSTHRR